MRLNNVLEFLDNNKIEYELDKKSENVGNVFIMSRNYLKVVGIYCYYDNCEIEIKGESDFERYDCDKYLNMDFLKDYK